MPTQQINCHRYEEVVRHETTFWSEYAVPVALQSIDPLAMLKVLVSTVLKLMVWSIISKMTVKLQLCRIIHHFSTLESMPIFECVAPSRGTGGCSFELNLTL